MTASPTAPQTPPPNTQNRADPLPDNAPHVLVVDDDHRIRDLLA
jgi:hypothetical protein